MAKNQVIDVRDMHTAIHSLFLVTRKPKTTLDLFWMLSTFNEDEPLDEFQVNEIWNEINQNTESLGEINYRNFEGDKFWRNGVLVSDVRYKDSDHNYKVIGSYDIW